MDKCQISSPATKRISWNVLVTLYLSSLECSAICCIDRSTVLVTVISAHRDGLVNVTGFSQGEQKGPHDVQNAARTAEMSVTIFPSNVC